MYYLNGLPSIAVEMFIAKFVQQCQRSTVQMHQSSNCKFYFLAHSKIQNTEKTKIKTRVRSTKNGACQTPA